MRRKIFLRKKLYAMLALIVIGFGALSYADLQQSGENRLFRDGTYTGMAEGYSGPLSVEVSISASNIDGVKVLEHREPPEYAEPLLFQMTKQMASKGTVNVDGRSGATITSEAVKAAVKDAVSQARNYQDGVYIGSAPGHNGPIVLEVAIINGRISKIKVLEHGETPGLADPALLQTPEAIVARSNPRVDLVSGATITAKAITEAATDALKKANLYKDGVYAGSAPGHNAPIEVEVLVVNGRVAEVKVLDHRETPGLADPAINQLPEAIKKQGTPSVDVLSGATITSNSIIQAVENALENAQ